MKRIIAVVAVLAIVLSASFVFAGNDKQSGGSSVDADLQQGQKQGQNQFQGQSSKNVNINAPSASSSSSSSLNNLNDLSNSNDVSSSNIGVVKGGTQTFEVTDKSVNNSRALGSLPEAYTHGTQLPVFPLTEYGHLVDQFSLKASTQLLPELTYNNFKVFTENLQEEGVENWDKVNKKILVYPAAINRFQKLADDDIVWFPSAEEFFRILQHLRPENIAGIYLYDTEFQKKNKVVTTYLQMKALSDSVRKGGNVCVAVDQFWQAHFLPEGWDFSIGGVISGITKGLLGGGSGAANAGMARGQNTATGNAGAAFAFFRVQSLQRFKMLAQPPKKEEKVCPPPKVEETKTTPVSPPLVEKPKPERPTCDVLKIRKQIEENLNETQECKSYCFNNMRLRSSIADLYRDLYKCIGDAESRYEAIKNYEIAARNFRFGSDIGKNRIEADSIIAHIYRNWKDLSSE